jgi:hypothetical protein
MFKAKKLGKNGKKLQLCAKKTKNNKVLEHLFFEIH